MGLPCVTLLPWLLVLLLDKSCFISESYGGEINKRQWIIFDEDVDPDWVENLNIVLDDNKLLTLPNGERLALPPNVRERPAHGCVGERRLYLL